MGWATALAIITASRRVRSVPSHVIPALRSIRSQHVLPSIPLQARYIAGLPPSRPGPQHTRIRRFHASPTRHALPMLPLLVLKSSSVLPATITVARVLLSFFPFISILGLRIRRKVRRIEDNPRPAFSPRAEAFVDKWCPDESSQRFTFLQVTTLNRKERKALMRQIEDSPRDPPKVTGDGGLHFLLPALPPASLADYTQMSVDEKEEVYLYRRYRAANRMINDVVGRWRWLVGIFAGLPLVVVLIAVLAAVERVPITGRWRVILMSPDEEDAISSNLAGEKWFHSVIAMLSSAEAPAPPIVPSDNWRWAWVQRVLRRLEAAALQDCKISEKARQSGRGSAKSEEPSSLNKAPPLLSPPPAAYPFKPRPRASASLHSVLPGGSAQSGQEHLQLGPPFSLLLMQKEEANAFSYGFGGSGAGGIVVYTGLLDNIMATDGPSAPIRPAKGFFHTLLNPFAPLASPRAAPTEQQDFHLATVLAHELGHLMLSHHLESLSSRQVLWPSIIGLATDVIRVMVWPVTVLFGPLLNDGLSNVSKTSINLLKEQADLPLSRIQELEADLVGLRLLARAGYDASSALDVWGDHVASLTEAATPEHAARSYQKHWADGSQSHPETRERIAAVRSELERWRYST